MSDTTSQLELSSLTEQQTDDVNVASPPPNLAHTLHQAQSSVLSLAADSKRIFSGSQGTDIHVWDRESYRAVGTLTGHTGSVLALELSPPKKWLFSSSGDSTVRVWSTETLAAIYVLQPYSDYAAGDIFSITFSPLQDTLFLGCQNTSLQWFNFSRDLPSNPESYEGSSTLTCSPGPSVGRKPHKFFDSFPQPAGRPQQQSIQQMFSPGPSYTTPSASSLLLQSPVNALSTPERTPPLHPPTALPQEDTSNLTDSTYLPIAPILLTVPEPNVVTSAHFGYIYCMALVSHSATQSSISITPPISNKKPSVQDTKLSSTELVTGSGDEDVKLWSYSTAGEPSMTLLHTFHGGVGGILSLISNEGSVYAGCQDGHVKVWDIDTKTLVRTIIVQEGVDILSLSMIDSDLYTCSANGWVHRYSASFDCTMSWKANNGITLSSIIVAAKSSSPHERNRFNLITGASDNDIKVWDITRPPLRKLGADEAELHKVIRDLALEAHPHIDVGGDGAIPIEANDTMIYALSQFVSFPSVSTSESYREDCRQAAIWLKKCFIQLGAESQLLYAVEGKNPLVLATFSGTQTRSRKPRILFYGHYDVVAAGSSAGWETDPFTLTGLNGYLYGRGVTDNKGPILAVACAASEMLAKRTLEIDLVLVIEGEEESGSAGFAEAIRQHKAEIGHIDAILVSNSYWIDDVSPCVTYGLRGVVHSTVEISSERPDLHSGVEGGAMAEPMMDMVKLLGQLSDGQKIMIPSFYDTVRPPSASEQDIYRILEQVTSLPAASFSTRWREPSLSIHSVHDSGPGNNTVIPAHVRAKVSLRIVPDQDLHTIIASLEVYVRSLFERLNSPNSLRFSIDRAADWWLGELEDPWFKALESAVHDEWGVKPLKIREGGSIPSIPFLEKEFKCHAVHLPMGQSSDQAHLRNERISLKNLRKGKSLIERFFGHISQQAI